MSEPTGTRTEVRHGGWFWTGVMLGWAVMAVGAWGVFRDANETHPDSFARWFFGGLVVHDLLLAPVVIGVGVAMARWMPRAVRPVAAAGLMVAGSAALYSVPLLLGYGERPANPSVLPRDYGAGLASVLGTVAAVAAVLAAVRWWWHRTRRGPAERRGLDR